ncbi:MAG TPA: MTH1187 family thiamine-binding protein [Moorella mulderi]|nr:MTH1187 family thiamine-binding protein [Moorella mulderi]
MKAIMEVSVIPLGTGSTSLSGFIAEIQKELERLPQIKYQLTPMGTIIEGELQELFSLLPVLHEIPFKQGCARVLTLMRIDDRRDKPASMEGKIRSVEEKLKP